MKNKTEELKVGDVVVVSNALFGLREYTVTKVQGHKAYTDFRVFNKKVYPPNMVYEYGKNCYSTTNGYWKKEKGQNEHTK